jgi:hypothetical protein
MRLGSSPRRRPRARGLVTLLALGLGACGCGGGIRRFPLKEPLVRDTDLALVSVPCEKRPSEKDPAHVSCAPEPYVSPLAWDAADNTIFRPLAKLFAVDPPREARNVNAFDEVPDSAWFTNRMGKRRIPVDELVRGACRVEDMLEGGEASPERWVIDQGKPNGASPGFRLKVDGKKKYMFKTDTKAQPERPSAASAIGAAIYHAVGFYTSCEQIVYVDVNKMKLTPGLTFTANDGVTKRFDDAALKKVLGEAARKGDTYRFQASAWLGGFLIGPFKYERTRSDDPNDVIPHEDRRDLRGARVLASWLHHFDAREQNSMDSWFSADPKNIESSPGFVRHYYLDTSDSFGSEWDWDAISRRLGHTYLLDLEDIGADFISLGAIQRPWERERRTPGMEMFGYFHWREFNPDAWYNEYPNPAFSRATEHDNAWMARILSRFDRADIAALVSLGKFSSEEGSAFLTEVLEMRLRKILARYLLRLSPVSDLRVEGRDSLCGLDLARRRGVRPDGDFRYAATVQGAPVRVDVKPEGELCMTLPHVAPDGGAADDAASRYVVVPITNGASRGRLDAHLYDLGPARGWRLVGLERPLP